MKVSVFCGVSVDGFLARRDDTLDFLPADGGEPHGYDEFMAGVDTIVIGRRTFEVVLSFGEWVYPPDKRVVVLTHRPIETAHPVELLSGTPAEVVARLEASGTRSVYVDGGVTIQDFLRAGLVHRLIVTRVPVLIGDGIPLFGPLAHDVRLRHVATRTFASGLVQSEYEVPATLPPTEETTR